MEVTRTARPLYPAVLGAAFDRLPAPLRRFHSGHAHQTWEGRAEVRRGTHPLARLVAWLLRFPAAGRDIPVEVVTRGRDMSETWTRHFGPRTLQSVQRASEGLLIERFGVVTVAVDLDADTAGLRLTPARLWCLGLPLPAALLPRSSSFERAEGTRFVFDVTVNAPLIGLIVAYRGWLLSDDPPGTIS